MIRARQVSEAKEPPTANDQETVSAPLNERPDNQRPALSVAMQLLCAAAMAGVAFFIRLMLTPWIGDAAPYMLFFIAGLIAAWRLGWLPGVMALGAGLLLGDYFFAEPPGSLGWSGTADAVRVVSYCASGGMAVWMCESLRRAHRRADDTAQRAYQKAARLEAQIRSACEADRRLHAEHAVARILLEEPTLEAAAPHVLRVLCECIDGQVAELWRPNATGSALRCATYWAASSRPEYQPFENMSRSIEFEPGVGLPGRVWQSGAAAAIPDLARDTNFPRTTVASNAGLRSGFAFPLSISEEFFGVIEFFTDRLFEADEALLRMMTAIGQDIAQFVRRRRAEEALQESQARLQLAMEVGRMGAWEWDMATGRVTWSPTLEAIHGLEGGFGGTFEDFKRDIHPDDLDHVMHAIRQAVETGQPFHIQYRIVKSGGEMAWLESRGRVLQDGSGRATGMAGICMDATDRKLAEEELANYRDRLEQLVAERTAELEQTHQRLRINERMAGLGTLSAGLGHDMGNLLLPIRARIDVLLAQDLSAAVVEHLKAIRQCADYLQSLTHGLRLLSLDPNEEEDHDPVLRLDKWWSTVEGLMRNALPRRVTLEARGFESAPPLAIAPHKLTQAVFNVIKNAGDALAGASDGRVVVNAEVGDARWKTATEDSSDVAFLSISDNGPGMPPDVRRRALEPFFTTKKRGLSTGLGLSLVNGIVTSVGGRIDIHAEPGQGTTVKLMLPIAARGMQSAAHAAGAMPPPGKLRAIISLDDQRQTSMLMQMLATAGFEVQSKPDHVAANIVSNGSLQHVQHSDTSLWVVQGRQEFRAAVQAFLNLSRAGRQSANGDHQIEPSQASSGPTPRVVLVLGAADQEWDESGVIALGGPFQLDRVRDAIQLAKAMLQGPHAPTAIGVSTASRSPHECAATQ